MKPLYRSTYILLFLCPLISNAQRYIGSTLSTPCFESSQEIKITSRVHYQPELHLAFALSDHWYVSALASRGSRNNTDHPIVNPDSSAEIIGHYSHKSVRTVFQAGFGYYNNYKPKRVFDIVGGITYGFGNSSNRLTYTNGTPEKYTENSKEFPFYQAYIQPSIGRNRKHFGWSFGTKISFFASDHPNITLTIIEPAYSANFGWKNLRIETQLGLRLPTSTKLNARYTIYGIGLSYRINRKDKVTD